MRILAIETATPAGGIALVDEEIGLVYSFQMASSLTHSERLMPAIQDAFQETGLSTKDLDAVAVSQGPGSFTGVRIGMSVAKGLVYAAGKPLVTVPTLEALAWRYFLPGRLVCPMIDARRGEVYAAFYKADEDGESLELTSKMMVAAPEVILDMIKEPVVFSGTGSLRYRKEITDRFGSRATFAPPNRVLPSPDEVAFRGLDRLRRKEFADAFICEPSYIRQSDAEISRSQRPPAEGGAAQKT